MTPLQIAVGLLPAHIRPGPGCTPGMLLVLVLLRCILEVALRWY